MTAPAARPGRPLLWKVLHAAIIFYFAYECLYSCWQVFVVYQPPGTFGPLNGSSPDVSDSIFMRRRLYAIEGWLAYSGMAIYLAVTELYPRFWAHHHQRD